MTNTTKATETRNPQSRETAPTEADQAIGFLSQSLQMRRAKLYAELETRIPSFDFRAFLCSQGRELVMLDSTIELLQIAVVHGLREFCSALGSAASGSMRSTDCLDRATVELQMEAARELITDLRPYLLLDVVANAF